MPACKCYDRPRTTQRNFWFVMLILSLLFIIIYFGLRSLFINHQEKVTNVSETTNNINHYEVSNKHPWRLNKTIMEGRKTLNNYSRRLVWPEELSNGDRIMEQILFVPSNYNRETAPIKKILLYNGIGYSWEIPRLGQEEFIDCPVSSCSMTTDKSLAPLVEAILFKHKYNGSEHIRPPNQIWIIYFTEGPYISPIFQDNNVFNWTATYRMDSDIPNPYSYWYQYNEQEIKIRPKVPKKNYASGKIKQVAWFVSDCKPFNNRSGYAHELSKHISVDIYGKCGPLKCPKSNKCFLMLKNTYKFYLAFENAHCMHYITEKLYTNAYNNDLIPVVMGPYKKDYELLAPKNSFIHVDDFDSPQSLANYLHKLDRNDDLYNEYFKWKGTGELVLYINNAMFYCRLCAMLHDDNHAPKHYADFNDWWRGEGKCNQKITWEN